jgi:hypothetical protein
VIDTNLTSAFLCSKAVHPSMKEAGGGKVINIGSMMSLFGASFAPAYAASKGGIVQFTSGPIPTFALRCSGHFCECWNQRTTRKYDSSGALDLTFAYKLAADRERTSNPLH